MMIIRRDNKKKQVQKEEIYTDDDLASFDVDCVVSYDSHYRITITWVDEDNQKETEIVLSLYESQHLMDFIANNIKLK